MLTKNERMNALSAAGINTSKYFTVDLDNGTKIHLIIDENGNPVRVDSNENDPIFNEIISDGYVRNSRLHRRFVMARMFQMLNYTSYDGQYSGYNDCLKRSYGYDYTMKMMTEEIRVLSKLEERDRETFMEREHFFNKKTVVAVLEDYIEKLRAYIEKLPSKNCKGVPYKRVKGNNIFVADLDKKVYAPVRRYIHRIKFTNNYKMVYNILCEFNRNMVKLPYNTPKSKAWIDAYKGNGAYYTLKNLVMFHNCGIEFDGTMMYGLAAVSYLNRRLNEYEGEGWRMFALMKKVISDNNINTKTYIRDICNK
jgi:hypothetical protein